MAAKIRETVVTTHSPESFNYPGDPTICEQECRIATNKVLVAYKRKNRGIFFIIRNFLSHTMAEILRPLDQQPAMHTVCQSASSSPVYI